ncbi:MAG TPA: hypothetical protein VIO11_02110 [Candidatus Methanoperedens sp.]
MSAKKFMKDFTISPVFPTILIPIWMVVVLVYNNILSSQNPIPTTFVAIGLIIFIIWATVRWSLEPKLNLIKEYNSLLNLLDNLDKVDRVITIWGISNQLNIKHPCWRHYFNEKGQGLDIMFNDVHHTLDKIIRNPYRLLSKKTMDDIRRRFNNLVWENYHLYSKFIEMVNDQNIPKNSYNYDKLKKAHEDFFSALNSSRARFVEIYNDHDSTCEFFNPLQEPKQ